MRKVGEKGEKKMEKAKSSWKKRRNVGEKGKMFGKKTKFK